MKPLVRLDVTCDGRLEGKVAVVTGGSSGIGLATAKRLHAEGARVAVCGRDVARLNGAAATIGDDVVCAAADVAKLAEIDRLFHEVADQLGGIDVLFIKRWSGQARSPDRDDGGCL